MLSVVSQCNKLCCTACEMCCLLFLSVTSFCCTACEMCCLLLDEFIIRFSEFVMVTILEERQPRQRLFSCEVTLSVEVTIQVEVTLSVEVTIPVVLVACVSVTVVRQALWPTTALPGIRTHYCRSLSANGVGWDPSARQNGLRLFG